MLKETWKINLTVDRTQHGGYIAEVSAALEATQDTPPAGEWTVTGSERGPEKFRRAVGHGSTEQEAVLDWLSGYFAAGTEPRPAAAPTA